MTSIYEGLHFIIGKGVKDPLESRVVKIRISTVKNAAIQNKVVVYFYLFQASMEHRIRDDLDPSPYLNMEESTIWE